MAGHQTCNEPLPEQILTQFTDIYAALWGDELILYSNFTERQVEFVGNYVIKAEDINQINFTGGTPIAVTAKKIRDQVQYKDLVGSVCKFLSWKSKQYKDLDYSITVTSNEYHGVSNQCVLNNLCRFSPNTKALHRWYADFISSMHVDYIKENYMI